MLPLSFLRKHWRLLAFGWWISFFSGFGQTYFVSIFGGEIRRTFDLGHAAFGTCYAIGTLASAAVLIWAGRLIDRRSLLAFSIAVIAGLALACAVMASVTGVVSLTLAAFGVRLFGQGLMTHAAMTAMGRYFEAERGRAVSFASLGHIAGWALLPLAAAVVMRLTDWRMVWLLSSALLVLVAMPTIALLLRRPDTATPGTSVTPSTLGPAIGATLQPTPALAPRIERASVTLGDALRDRDLYLRLPVLLAPAFITTGLIFHQVHIGTVKGWSLTLIASALSVFALGSLLATLVSGIIVDRWSARRLLPFCLAPIAVACLVLAHAASAIAATAYFGILGFGSGLMQVVLGAIWAELYGVTHLGAIRAFGTSAMVFSSGLAPAVMGAVMDVGWTVDALALSCAAYCVLASAVSLLARYSP